MGSISYEIDAGGNMELVLKNPNSQQTVPVISPSKDGKGTIQDETFKNSQLGGRYAPFHGQKAISEVRFRVSSRHLILASRTFRSMLEGPWTEATSTSPTNNSVRQIIASDWDAISLAIVLDIIHGRHKEVPRVINLRTLTNIATMAEYYRCLEVVEIFGDRWFNILLGEPTQKYSGETLMWLYVSWIFSKRKILANVTETILEHMDGLQADTKDLPLAEILGTIDKKRREYIGKILVGLYELRNELPDESGCVMHGARSPSCASITLGILVRELERIGQLDPPLVHPFEGYSVSGVMQMVRDIPESLIDPPPDNGDHLLDGSSCSVPARMGHVLAEVKSSIKSWTFDWARDRCEGQVQGQRE
ncbi:hypothetical protein FBEOM_7406 [Fusarium beomiforme]|uniref:BTB domain-containing protein n=1 Tax=Fusarium beomiforme TaxID=44412 RepID=A0A9P5AH47_9HYPO|nr:hypothetical protein FBEOM_7406 [Fusarium beomiforme]